MLDFAVKVTESANRIVEQNLEEMRAAGWADEDILHIIEIAAMFSLTGRLANAIGLVANAEYSALGRVPREAAR